MTEADKRYYDRKAIADEKRNKALAKANKRGEAAKEWFAAGNKLTKETQAEFNALMKKVDKQSENGG